MEQCPTVVYDLRRINNRDIVEINHARKASLSLSRENGNNRKKKKKFFDTSVQNVKFPIGFNRWIMKLIHLKKSRRKSRKERDEDKAARRVRVREGEGIRGRMNASARTIDEKRREKRRVVAFLGKSVRGVPSNEGEAGVSRMQLEGTTVFSCLSLLYPRLASGERIIDKVARRKKVRGLRVRSSRAK